LHFTQFFSGKKIQERAIIKEKPGQALRPTPALCRVETSKVPALLKYGELLKLFTSQVKKIACLISLPHVRDKPLKYSYLKVYDLYIIGTFLCCKYIKSQNICQALFKNIYLVKFIDGKNQIFQMSSLQ